MTLSEQYDEIIGMIALGGRELHKYNIKDQVAQLEAKLAARLENDGEECPLCVCKAEVERLQAKVMWYKTKTGLSVGNAEEFLQIGDDEEAYMSMRNQEDEDTLEAGGE